MKTQNKMKLGYEISMAKGSFKPVQIQFWSDESQFKKVKPAPPLKYFADAILGLSIVRLNHFLKSPLHVPHMNYSFAFDAWKALDPHCEIFQRSQERLAPIRKHSSKFDPKKVEKFEVRFTEALQAAQKPWGIDLKAMAPLLSVIQDLEDETKAPLLFNFGLHFSKNFMEQLHIVYSMLFQLRSVVAVDYNAHVEDASHEAVKVDAITDYLPKAEYVVNDALMYWNFKKLSQPFSKSAPAGFDKLMVNPMEQVFQKYSHNACCLVDQLPPAYLAALKPAEMEDALYSVQMDWLLGSEAGLLFKVREELFGLQTGYEKLFWNEVEPQAPSKAVNLCVNCELSEAHVSANQAA
jgi:hypothetical protein